ncbi:MAG TPA: hypothetical protein VH301_00900 [Usitatibacter sp.]|nr:hypothetical protein [Usitatibacter sp.]
MHAAAAARALAHAALAGFALLLFAASATAARPLTTDDARIVDPKSCQVESWIKANKDSTEYWALPACNPFGWFEINYGGARTRENGAGSTFTDNVMGFKTIVKPLEPNGWGWGVSVGTDRHLHRESGNGWPGDEVVNVPVSVSFRDDEIVMHVNAGAVRRRDLDRSIVTWGIGTEVRLRDDTYFIGESFANDRGRPFYQLGARYTLV